MKNNQKSSNIKIRMLKSGDKEMKRFTEAYLILGKGLQ